MIILAMILTVLWISIYGVLVFYKKPNRLVQILTSLVAVDIALRLLLICSVFMLKYSVVAVLILLIPLMYWEFILYIFIFANGFSVSYLKSGMFALVYMIIQHNLSEILAHYFIRI